MTLYVCTKCGERMKRTLNVFEGTKCPSCGSTGTLIDARGYEAYMGREEERKEVLGQLGTEPEDWKVVGASMPLFGEVKSAKDIQRILTDIANEGWQFVFFGDSARLVDGPVLIFKRERLKPTEKLDG